MSVRRIVRQLPSGAKVVATLAATGEGSRLRVIELSITAPVIVSSDLRAVPLEAMEREANAVDLDELRREIEALPPLKRSPDTTPEAFSALVAEHFKVWARHVPHPAAEMAAHACVKPPTMHTWIREARLRGLLPPAPQRRGGTP